MSLTFMVRRSRRRAHQLVAMMQNAETRVENRVGEQFIRLCCSAGSEARTQPPERLIRMVLANRPETFARGARNRR